jgi:eukaryotic-like serine/threonine-protein kinase
LGPYEILDAIGAGGMGEVYRARDTRLDRIVAIKVLPVHLADQPELRERFEREARTIASLNHPHICTLHDVGHQDGTDYLVMEYLEGETLGQRLLKSPLPLEQVLPYAIEIADALDKAHRKGVTHRDLKPGNIMLTKSGTKLLDFGLAKLRQDVAPNIQVSQSPTMSQPLTAQGMIVGTLQYMAPEQLEGREVDARTDIFAFGTVVYEMVTGKKVFEGKSQASVIAKILETDPPPISSLQPMTPPALDRVVKTCLAKEPDERWQTAGDLCRELKWIAKSGPQMETAIPAAGPAGKNWRKRLLWGAAGLAACAIVVLAVWSLKPASISGPQPVSRFTITLPPGQRLAGLENGSAVALSPDGTHLAYVAIQSGAQQIYLRAMDSLDARPIPDTEGAVNPFFSPDGQWLGFFADGKLKKVSASGGAALTLGSATTRPCGASWSSHGMIAFAPRPSSALQQVSDARGTPQPLTHLDKRETSHRWPEFLPGGNGVLFAADGGGGDWGNAQVEVQPVGTAQRSLIQGGMQPRFAASGHLIYAQGGSLMAVPFDRQRLEVTGAAVPVVEGVLQSVSTGAVQYSVSASGSLAYVPGGIQTTLFRLLWVSRDGAEQPVAAPAHNYGLPRLSPDGKRAAVMIGEQGVQVWLYDFARDTLTRLTFEGPINAAPVWTPDGKRIAFTSTKEGPGNIFWQMGDGSGGLEQLTTSKFAQIPRSWSPDGQLLTFVELNPTTGRDIWVLRMSDHKAQPFLRTQFNETAPQFSPDGRWLAYISDESGRNEVYVQPYPGPGGKWQISTEGGTEPMWNRSGRELFYRSGDEMMAVDIAAQPGFTAGKPRMLFEAPYALSSAPNYDVSPDGQRFLMLKPIEQEQAGPTQINVVLNWFEELKQKVPVGNK